MQRWVTSSAFLIARDSGASDAVVGGYGYGCANTGVDLSYNYEVMAILLG